MDLWITCFFGIVLIYSLTDPRQAGLLLMLSTKLLSTLGAPATANLG